MKRAWLAIAMAALLSACGGQSAGGGADGTDGTVYTVGICQLMRHEALDAATAGFTDALNQALPGKVRIQEKITGEDFCF